MAWKFRQEYFEDGDIIEPSDWRINQEEFTSELNGALDSDNLYKKVIEPEFFIPATFNVVQNSINLSASGSPYQLGTAGHLQNSGRQILFEHSESGWLSKNESGQSLPVVKLDSKEDGLIIVDAMAQAKWSMGDADDVDASSNILYSYFRPNGVYIRVKSAYVLCAMFRITCNGLSVCHAGPIGNDYVSRYAYLCGALPITAGQNVIRMEVRHVWYSPGNDRYIESSAKKPSPEHGVADTTDDPDHVRSDVWVNGALFVNHRKR